ncbi:MAG: purine-binding chemotaxis protein CheW [Lachnospiraceae bacterium]|nr:purine-binding chemotaxis protein CheW [Lachnospiraceae bacterium]
MDEGLQLNEFQRKLREKVLKENDEIRRQTEIENAPEEEEDTQRDRYMTFKCGEDYFGIGIGYVDEIIGIQQIAQVPDTPDYVMGLINLRGKIIPIMDVRIRFKKPPIPYDDRTCVIVVTIGETMIGLIVDTIAEVVTITEEDILAPPTTGNNASNRFVYGLGRVGGDVKLLVDPEKLIGPDEPEI